MLYNTIRQTATSFVLDLTPEKVTEDIAVASNQLTPDCVRWLLPPTMASILTSGPGAEGKALTNLDYEAQLMNEMKVFFADWKIDLNHLIIDEKAKRAVAIADYHFIMRGSGKTRILQFTYILHFTDKGERITEIHEVCDTHALAQLLGGKV